MFGSSASVFNRTEHNHRILVADFPLVDPPAILFVNGCGDGEAIDVQALYLCPTGYCCCFLKNRRGDTAVAHFRFNKHRSHPRRVLLPEHAVVLDHGAASNGSAVGEGDDRKWDLILLRMSAQPGENDFSRVMALAPPLVEDPIADGLHVLRALRELFHSTFHGDDVGCRTRSRRNFVK